MKRLTIYLKKVEKINKKITNTLSFKVKNDKQIADHLSMHGNNVKKHSISNL